MFLFKKRLEKNSQEQVPPVLNEVAPKEQPKVGRDDFMSDGLVVAEEGGVAQPNNQTNIEKQENKVADNNSQNQEIKSQEYSTKTTDIKEQINAINAERNAEIKNTVTQENENNSQTIEVLSEPEKHPEKPQEKQNEKPEVVKVEPILSTIEAEQPIKTPELVVKNSQSTIASGASVVNNIKNNEGHGLEVIKADNSSGVVIENQGDPKYESIGQKLIRKKIISEDQLEIALKIQRVSKKNVLLGQIMVENGFLTELTLNQILTEGKGVKIFNPKESPVDPNILRKIPKDVATKISAAPFMLDDKNVHILMTDIYDLIAIDAVRKYFPSHLNFVLYQCSRSDFGEIITNYYEFDLSIAGILKEIEKIDKEELIKIASDGSYVNPTVRLVDVMLFDAIRMGASDIHLEPEGLFVRVRYRIDGVLKIIRSFHIDYWSAVVVRVKIMSNMNIAESRIPQDGRITFATMGRNVDFRVAVHPTIHGENIVLRILDKNKAILPMTALGYSEINVERLKKALKRPEGIIIVTGPTGSGKSTTLYSIINFINTVDVNIMTIEDPVEYQLSMIRQTNIREGGVMDFAKGIKSSLRQDPDVIFVGEVRDQETATLALRAAMTGHRVFTSLHTNDAIGSITRLMDIGVNARILSENIVACIAQRLTRKLCSNCKVEKKANAEECKLLNVDVNNPPIIFTKVGCEKCGFTGYKGRVAISEILLIDSTLAEMIGKSEMKNKMIDYVNANGFVSMVDDGVDKVLKGQLDLEELVDTVDLTTRM
jgi:type IV pilus assembly protein PilB